MQFVGHDSREKHGKILKYYLKFCQYKVGIFVGRIFGEASAGTCDCRGARAKRLRGALGLPNGHDLQENGPAHFLGGLVLFAKLVRLEERRNVQARVGRENPDPLGRNWCGMGLPYGVG
jgi:hypothetical protein